MALTQKSYNLKGIRVTLNSGVLLDCTSISIAMKIEIKDRTSGASLTEQRVINKAMAPEITIEGFNSDALTMADLAPGTAITAFTVLSTESGTPSMLPADFFTKWPVDQMSIGDTDTSFGESDPSKWKTQILCGILNPDALA